MPTEFHSINMNMNSDLQQFQPQHISLDLDDAKRSLEMTDLTAENDHVSFDLCST